MLGEYRFLRTRGGTKFARVRVRSEADAAWNVSFEAAVGPFPVRWSDAIREGIDHAVAHHERLGGHAHRVIVEEVQATTSDTTEDALSCAAAIAAWKSWGRDEESVRLAVAGDQWSVTFSDPAGEP